MADLTSYQAWLLLLVPKPPDPKPVEPEVPAIEPAAPVKVEPKR